ncbi:MAG: hypothetical protein EBQ86_10895 [Betaproteobacteria bacterium]|nr:hypothetical protein [Burkholderiales bacterium]NBX90581.1 hypothetical protein [Betaproteobacteria bacterium]
MQLISNRSGFFGFDSGVSNGVRNDSAPLGGGCGSASNDAYIPDVFFGINLTQACISHDASYATCGVGQSFADDLFRTNIQSSCTEQGGNALVCGLISNVYSLGVRIGGGSAYKAAQAQSCLISE